MKICKLLILCAVLTWGFIPVAVMADPKIPVLNEADLKLDLEPSEKQAKTPEKPALKLALKLAALTPEPVKDAEETDAIKITPDKPEIVMLDRDAVNVIVGSNQTLRVVPDTNRALVLIPKKPGSTYFQALDVNGKVIMRRHVIVGVAKKDYVRIRRTCAAGDANCREFSVYYCPDMCHEVSVMQDVDTPSPPVPTDTAANRPLDDIDTAPEAAMVPVLDEAGQVSPPPAAN